LSICPHHAAEDVADLVITDDYSGLYLDVNAISPKRAEAIGDKMKTAGIGFVDVGIIGGPAWEPNSMWMYLSGEKADVIASIFSKGPLKTKVIGNEIGKASALKVCYAAYTKGTSALLSAILAVAKSNNVREELANQWDIDDANFSEQVNRKVRWVTAKAWRFEVEMREIAETFDNAGIPSGFQNAAAEIYHRMAGFKDAPEIPKLDDVLTSLLQNTSPHKRGCRLIHLLPAR